MRAVMTMANAVLKTNANMEARTITPALAKTLLSQILPKPRRGYLVS